LGTSTRGPLNPGGGPITYGRKEDPPATNGSVPRKRQYKKNPNTKLAIYKREVAQRKLERAQQKRERVAEMIPFIEVGCTLEEIGNHFGLTRERVRQLLAEQGVHSSHVERAKKEAVDRRAAQQYNQVMALMQNALDNNRKCVVCDSWVIRRPAGQRSPRTMNITCSTECGKLWAAARHRLSAEGWKRHRMFVARSILNNPQGKSPSRIAWAIRLLANPDMPANRYMRKPGSKVSQMLEEAGLPLERPAGTPPNKRA
jgi:hypothetical protein